MELLYQQHRFDEITKQCDKFRYPEPQGLMHETFCCKKEVVRYVDRDTREEVAVITYQTDAQDASKNRRVIRKLKVANDIFALKLPV